MEKGVKGDGSLLQNNKNKRHLLNIVGAFLYEEMFFGEKRTVPFSKKIKKISKKYCKKQKSVIKFNRSGKKWFKVV